MAAELPVEDGEPDVPIEQVAKEAEELEFDSLVDPYRSGYVAREANKPRRPRECYMRLGKIAAEKRELWYQGYDEAEVDIKEQQERDIKAWALKNKVKRKN